MKTLRAGVIGTGFIGPAHVEALRRIPGVRITAIGSIDSARARGIADQFAIPRAYEGWAELVRDPEVDVIHNCTPNNLHFEINRAAVLEGKHVISEKPLTMTPAQSAELVRLVRRKGVVNAVNFNYRFYPLIQHARAMVRKGQLGETYLVHGHYLQDWLYYDTDYNWRLEPAISGVSRAVADIGSHWLDLIQFVTGRKITRVCATLKTIHGTRQKPAAAVETFKGKQAGQTQTTKSVSISTEDAAIVMFDLDNGGKGVVTLSQVSAGRKNREWFEIDGSKAAIAWNQEEPNELWVGRRDRPNESVIKDPSLLDASARKYAHYPGGHPEGYPEGPKNLFTNVYEFIRSGRDPRSVTPEFPTFADGHRENLIVQAVLASSRSGRWVNLPR
jgi:predicted dehydrogenase